MKKKLACLILIGVFEFITQNVHAQYGMILQFNDKTVVSTSLSTINKITFSNENLVLKFNTGSAISYSLSKINNLFFQISSQTKDISTSEMKIFPNPATDYIEISNLNSEDTEISIFNLSGMQIMCARLNMADNKLNVSSLKKGIYILKIASNTFKFSKL